MRLSHRIRGASRLRALAPKVDALETRELLSTATTRTLSPLSILRSHAGGGPPAGALTPAQVQTAYGFNNISFGGVKGDGTGQTIAIVDAYDDPNIQNDLNVFSTQFGLPQTTVIKVNQTGGSTMPGVDASGGWEMEIALDVQWAHAMAPNATILLVEANSASDADLLAAVDYASAHASVVSMSWGGGEWSGETSTSYENHFKRAGVTFVASSGDNGAPASWPAVSPNVLSVGGTALTVGAGGAYGGESGWSGSGGGPSAYFSQPSYEKGVVTQTTTKRANPDVAYDASPSTGFAVYDSFTGGGGWITVGGTSAGAPQWAALIAVANQGRKLAGQAPINSTSSQEVMTVLYKGAGTSMFHDITTGSSAGSPTYAATRGFDYVTGVGSPVANLVVQAFTGTVTPPPTADTLVVSAVPTSTTAGAAFNVTITAQTSTGATDPAYVGKVHFTSSDGQAGLPADYTFTAADAGVHTFTVTLKTVGAGTQYLAAADTASGNSVKTGAIAVSPAAASSFTLTGLATASTAGAPLTFAVTAYDPYGNVATNYAGTVHLSSSDGSATLPADYTFTTADKGVHAFSIAFNTAGSQTATVADVNGGPSVVSPAVSVSPAAPTTLTGQVNSSVQITLSWTSAAGATGYSVERSLNGSTGWSQVGTTAAGQTSYVDSGLSAGTTYYYRVRATGNGASSAYSNVFNATTTGSTTNAAATSLWGNSYTPSIDYYSSGNYELGMRFKSDVAGKVTGARFYKQTWMSGYSHVGHLWSASGQLLATATFTNETASGWQQVSFSKPVSITANTVYMVSFSTGGGYFGISSSYFATAGYDNGTLHAPSGAGVYATRGNKFPTVDSGGMNFWTDVVFAPSVSPAIVAKTSTTSPGVPPIVLPTGPGSTSTSPTPGSGCVSNGNGSTAVNTQGNWPNRRTVPQTFNFGSSRSRWDFGWNLGG